MYVSVTAGEGHGDFLMEAHSPIDSGTAVLPWGDGPDHDVSSLFNESLSVPISWARLYVLEVDQEQFVVEDLDTHQRMLIVKYAWWIQPDEGHCGVITTRNIFIMGESGQTIARVR